MDSSEYFDLAFAGGNSHMVFFRNDIYIGIMEKILCILIDLILAGLAIWFIVENFMYYLS